MTLKGRMSQECVWCRHISSKIIRHKIIADAKWFSDFLCPARSNATIFKNFFLWNKIILYGAATNPSLSTHLVKLLELKLLPMNNIPELEMERAPPPLPPPPTVYGNPRVCDTVQLSSLRLAVERGHSGSCFFRSVWKFAWHRMYIALR
jgi:hypothetical protein